MSTKRWTLILATALAALAGVAALLHATREPAVNPPALPAEPVVAALPLNRPPAASAAEAVPSATPRSAAPERTAAAATSALRIGSEGYGPHIERAQAGNDAAAAWEAVQWLRLCASNEERRQSYELVRGERIPQEMLTQLMLEADAEARLCQTVTGHHRGMLQELALRAIRGAVPHAAIGFAGLVAPGNLPSALRQEVADAIRRDANAGQLGTLLGAMREGAAWGLSDDERLAYLVAYSEMDGHVGQAMVKQWIAMRAIPFKADPTPQQLAAAQATGQQIANRVRANKQP